VQHARIVVSVSSRVPAAYQFDLIDVDGPRHGQRLADIEVPVEPPPAGPNPGPDPARAAHARYQLRAYGKRNAYVVTEDPIAPSACSLPTVTSQA
jgi:hypothetical protein